MATPATRDDGGLLTIVDDDDAGDCDYDDTDSLTSGAISRDTDRSRGDLTCDRTEDGPSAAWPRPPEWLPSLKESADRPIRPKRTTSGVGQSAYMRRRGWSSRC